MVDRYWRQIEDVENDIENAMQISAILLKLKGYDNKLGELSKIGDNENNISSNLSKIGDNENNISSNLSKIGDNENNISSNLSKIGDNENNISSNLSKIGDNENNISTNLSKIDNFTQYILKSGKDFEEKYTIEKQIFRFNKDKHFYTIFEKEIEYNFTKNSLLFVKNNMYYKYDNLSNDYHRLQHEYNIYDGNNLIHEYLFNKDTYYDENLDPILHTNEDFCICFKKNYKKIKINLQLHRHNRHGSGNINLEIDDTNENYINIDYLDKNNEDIEKNKKDISTNLSKINTNVGDIPSNLGKIDSNINAIKLINKNSQDNSKDILTNSEKINNITAAIVLKNIYFTDFDSTDKLIRKELLRFDNDTTTIIRSLLAFIDYKEMEYNFKKDDFIEVECKLIINHSIYDIAKNNLSLYYELFQKSDKNTNTEFKIFCKEIRSYKEFNEISNSNRITTYTKLYCKVKSDISKIVLRVYIDATSLTRKTYLIVNHDIIEKGVNYISVKHYGKS